jgi:hypothetical protein
MTKRTWLGLIVVVGFVLLKFYPFFLQQRYPVPFDILAGGYWPWRLVDYGYPAGVPIKNPIVSDVVSQLFVWNDLAWKLSKQGLLPLWDRYSLLGYPYYANYHSAIFFPLNALGLILDSTSARTLVLLITQVLAGLGMYGFLIYKKKSTVASVLAAIVFVTGGMMTTDFLFASGSRAISFLPYIFWLTDLYIHKKRLLHLKLLAISWLMLLLSGHFQVTVYATFLWHTYLLVQKIDLRTKIKLICFWLLGVLASFIQLIPTIELLGLSFRNAEGYISQVNFGLLPLKHLVTTFFAPDFFGNNATGNYFGFWNYRESVGYLGLIPSFLLMLGAIKKPKDFYTITFLISLLFVFVPPIGVLVYKFHLPLISGSAASRLLFLTTFSGSILVADGLDYFLKKKITWPIILFSGLFFCVIIWVVIEKIVYIKSGINLSHEIYFKNNLVSLRNLVLPCLGYGILFIFSLLILFFRKRLAPILSVLLVLFVAGDLARYHFKWNTFNAKSINPQEYKLTEKLDDKRRLASTSDEIFPPNSSTLLRMPSLLGYDPLFPLNNGVYLNAINGDYDPSHVNRYFNNVSNTKSNLLDYAGVGYLATLTRDKQGLLSEKGSVPYYIDTNKWIAGYREREMIILQNKEALPLFYFAKDVVSLEKQKQIQAMVTDDNLKTYIDSVPTSNADNGQGMLSYSILENGDSTIKTKNENDAYLVYSQATYPGWEALIDGKPTEMRTTNYLFGSILVPKGEHNIVWRFRPKSFYFGTFVSILSLLVISLYRDEQKTGRVS